MTLYLFYGQEDFLMDKDIGKLKNKLLDKSFVSMSYKTFSNPKFSDLIDILNTQPMMFGNSVIIIECNSFFDNKPEISFDDKQLTLLEKSLSLVPEQINIIFLYKIDRNINKKIDTRRKIYKILSKFCEIKEYKQLPTYDKGLPPVVIKLAKENELELTSESASKLIEMLGSNLRVIDNELKKLKLYIYPQKNPTIKDIESICTINQNIFKLVDNFVLSQKDDAIKELSLLTQTQHPLQILSMLQGTISRFINLKLLSRNMNSFEISKKVNMHEFRVKLELEKIRNYRYDELLQLKKNLIDCEFKIKTGQIYSEEIAIEQLILSKAE